MIQKQNTVVIHIRVTAEQAELWKKSAEGKGIGLSEWIRLRCNECQTKLRFATKLNKPSKLDPKLLLGPENPAAVILEAFFREPHHPLCDCAVCRPPEKKAK